MSFSSIVSYLVIRLPISANIVLVIISNWNISKIPYRSITTTVQVIFCLAEFPLIGVILWLKYGLMFLVSVFLTRHMPVWENHVSKQKVFH